MDHSAERCERAHSPSLLPALSAPQRSVGVSAVLSASSSAAGESAPASSSLARLKAAATVPTRVPAYRKSLTIGARIVPSSTLLSVNSAERSKRAGKGGGRAATAVQSDRRARQSAVACGAEDREGSLCLNPHSTSSASVASELPVTSWARSARAERLSGAQALQLVQALFQRVVVAHPQSPLAFSTAVTAAVGRRAGASDGHSPSQPLLSLATRVAVSAAMLQTVVHQLPRHQRSLEPFARLLLQAVYPPDDVPELTAALCGSIECPAILAGLQASSCRPPPTGDPAGPLSPFSETQSARGSCTMSFDDEEGNVAQVMAAFARMPYFMAHADLSRRVVVMAGALRAAQVHTQRLPKILSLMNRSWSKMLLRTVVHAWRQLCNERAIQSQKHRMRWARRWATERVLIGIRRWRAVALFTTHSAEADTAAKAAITEKKETIRRYLLEVEGMRTTSASLSHSLKAKEDDQAATETILAESERAYKALLERVREADSVGCERMKLLLLPLPVSGSHDDAPPPAHADGTTRTQDGDAPAALVRAPPGTAAALWTQHHVQALAKLVDWADSTVATTGCETEQLCAMSAAEAEREMNNGGSQKSRPSTQGSASATAENSLAASTAASTTSAAPHRATGMAVEPVFHTLIAHTVLAATLAQRAGRDGQRESSRPRGNGSRAYKQAATTEISDSSPAAFVPIPLYKYLVLMRCFSHDGGAGVGPGSSAVAGGAGGVSHAAAHTLLPPIDTVRMVKTADADILASLTVLHQRAAMNLTPEDADDGGRGSAGGASLVGMLPRDMRLAAEDMSKIVIDSYERLTGTACVVSAQQLLTRTRGPQLMLLAALLKHFSNWSLRYAQVQSAADSVAGDVAREPAPHSAAADGASQTFAAAHMGRRHAKYPEWCYPPSSERQWPLMVAHQRQWVAWSFSALHRALRESQRAPSSLSVEEQDSAVGFARAMPLASIADVLPGVPQQTTAFYMGIVKTMEQCFVGLQHVFSMYSVNLADVQRAQRSQRQRTGDTLEQAIADENERASARADSVADADASATGSAASVNGTDDGRYITANAFWHLLCDAQVAGSEKDGCAFATLHRAAVFSIVEHVVFRALDAGQGADGGDASAGQPLSQRAAGPAGMQPSSHVSFKGDDCDSNNSSGSRPPTRQQRQPRQVGAGKLIPCFARAVQEQRHVDLRHDRATACMSRAQFAEAIVRCAHYWQALQSRTASRQDPPTASPSWNASSTGTVGRAGPPVASVRVEGDDGSAASSKPAAGADSLSRRGSLRMFSSRPSFRRPSAAGMGSAAPARVCVRYEGVVGACEPVNPQLLQCFLVDHVIPRLLGGPGGHGTAPPPMPPFRHAIRDTRVHHLIAAHQDTLFLLFAAHAKPREGFGLRSGLPPPYCLHNGTETHAEGNPISGTGAGAHGTGRLSGRLESRPCSASSATIGETRQHDAGIVALMTLVEVELLVESLACPQLSAAVVAHCFGSVCADAQREAATILFPEFLDLICAFAAYACPSPLTPMHTKLESFLRRHVLHED